MRIIFFLSISLSFLFAEDWEINPLLLKQKMDVPHPWMLSQIEEDLSPFKEIGVTQEMIEKTIVNIYALPGNGGRARLARVKISNNAVEITKLGPFHDLFSSLDNLRVSFFRRFCEHMSLYFPLPDIEFLLCLWDYFDNPMYVEAAECPVFTISKRKNTKKGVLFPEVQSYHERMRIYNFVATHRIPHWTMKKEIAYWRGRTTGGIYTVDEWDKKPRSQLCLFSLQHPALLDAGFATIGLTLTTEMERLLEKAHLFKHETARSEWLKYKYLIAIDGNSFASSLWWELLSTSVTLKGNSDFIEWFYKGIEPYVHYVPFEQDCSDLAEKIQWLKENDLEAQNIVRRANLFVLDNLSLEDMMTYFYYLFNAYAKLQR